MTKTVGNAAEREADATPDASRLSADADNDMPEVEGDGAIREARTWQDDGWTAQVIKNEDDEGWAVSMTRDGEPEPSLVGPWTMGRDKKNPKPMDGTAFQVLVKTASEVRRRHEQHMHAMLHKNVDVDHDSGRIRVTLDIVPDEYEPHAILRAFDVYNALLAEVTVPPEYKLNARSAEKWIACDFARPQVGG
jgi:hypothetical protein